MEKYIDLIWISQCKADQLISYQQLCRAEAVFLPPPPPPPFSVFLGWFFPMDPYRQIQDSVVFFSLVIWSDLYF